VASSDSGDPDTEDALQEAHERIALLEKIVIALAEDYDYKVNPYDVLTPEQHEEIKALCGAEAFDEREEAKERKSE